MNKMKIAYSYALDAL